MSSAAAQIAAKARRLAPHLQSGVVTLQGPQGSGKSALVEALVEQKRAEGVRCAAASLDDFYLPHTGLKDVAARNAGNALLQGRGLPGTHDLALLASVLGAIKRREGVELPAFDKSAHKGFGDRHAEPIRVSEPLDLFILEGWCVNTRPLPASVLAERHPAGRVSRDHPLSSLEAVNAGFAELERVLQEVGVGTRMTLRAEREWVYAWRLEQEEKLREEKGQGMSEEEVRAFVDRYMPVYECWDAAGDVDVLLDRGRQIVDVVERG